MIISLSTSYIYAAYEQMWNPFPFLSLSRSFVPLYQYLLTEQNGISILISWVLRLFQYLYAVPAYEALIPVSAHGTKRYIHSHFLGSYALRDVKSDEPPLALVAESADDPEDFRPQKGLAIFSIPSRRLALDAAEKM